MTSTTRPSRQLGLRHHQSCLTGGNVGAAGTDQDWHRTAAGLPHGSGHLLFNAPQEREAQQEDGHSGLAHCVEG